MRRTSACTSANGPVTFVAGGRARRLLPREGMQRAWRFLCAMWTEINENELTDLAAQLAYWAILALFPFLMCLLTVLGYLPLQGLADSVMATLYRFLPAEAHDTVASVINEVVGKQRGGLLLATLLGALWSASG